MRRRHQREPALAQRRQGRLVPAQRRRPGRGPGLHQRDRPRVPPERLARRAHPAADLVAPRRRSGIGQLDLAEHEVDQPVEDLVLVGDVVVDRHRLDAELLGQRPDRQRRQAAGVGDGERAAHDPVPAQRLPGHFVHSTVPWPYLVRSTPRRPRETRHDPHDQPLAQHPPDVATMRAVVQDGYGDARSVLGLDRPPVPTIKADQVLVAVHAAGLDRGTWHLMTGRRTPSGWRWGSAGRGKPVPGRDLAGRGRGGRRRP